jgi:hypothetical protein
MRLNNKEGVHVVVLLPDFDATLLSVLCSLTVAGLSYLFSHLLWFLLLLKLETKT